MTQAFHHRLAHILARHVLAGVLLQVELATLPRYRRIDRRTRRFITAIAEIVGCYLPLLWLRGQAKIWVLLPAAGALFAFVWLLTLHPNEAGRTYAAYGCVYVAIALGWLWVVEGIKPTRWDALGVGLAITGMLVIVCAPRGTAP